MCASNYDHGKFISQTRPVAPSLKELLTIR